MSQVHPGLYRHFKGGLYLVLGTVLHHHTGDEMVIYKRALQVGQTLILKTDMDPQNSFAREAGDFLETVADAEGNSVPRFAPVVLKDIS
jgi:hypothetical protein